MKKVNWPMVSLGISVIALTANLVVLAASYRSLQLAWAALEQAESHGQPATTWMSKDEFASQWSDRGEGWAFAWGEAAQPEDEPHESD